jgi:hypothetical protein
MLDPFSAAMPLSQDLVTGYSSSVISLATLDYMPEFAAGLVLDNSQLEAISWSSYKIPRTQLLLKELLQRKISY